MSANGGRILSSTVLPITEEPHPSKSYESDITVESVLPNVTQLGHPYVQDQGIVSYTRGKSAIGFEIEDPSKLRGLSSLAIANGIHIKVNKSWWRCGEVEYLVNDSETGNLIFTAIEDVSWCCGRGLNTILLRDSTQHVVARVCYKDQRCCSKKLVMAVYTPSHFLVGIIQEQFGCLGSTEFSIRNSDDKPLYNVEYKNGGCRLCCCGATFFPCGSPHFDFKSLDTDAEVGKILEKNGKGLRLDFKMKLDITAKVILTGFCIGLVHKSYHQKLE